MVGLRWKSTLQIAWLDATRGAPSIIRGEPAHLPIGVEIVGGRFSSWLESFVSASAELKRVFLLL